MQNFRDLRADSSLGILQLAELEEEFWRIVEAGDEVVEVVCGANLDTADCGSGFPTVNGALVCTQGCSHTPI